MKLFIEKGHSLIEAAWIVTEASRQKVEFTFDLKVTGCKKKI
jgi:hypothetical protein